MNEPVKWIERNRDWVKVETFAGNLWIYVHHNKNDGPRYRISTMEYPFKQCPFEPNEGHRADNVLFCINRYIEVNGLHKDAAKLRNAIIAGMTLYAKEDWS